MFAYIVSQNSSNDCNLMRLLYTMKNPPKKASECKPGTRFVSADCIPCHSKDVIIRAHCRSKQQLRQQHVDQQQISQRMTDLLPHVSKIMAKTKQHDSKMTVRDMYVQRLANTALQLPVFIAFAVQKFKSPVMKKQYTNVTQRLEAIGHLWQMEHGGINMGKLPAVQFCILSV